MPNWVYNTLEFNSVKDLEKVWKGMRFEFPDGDISFSYESIIPSPRTRQECPKGFFVDYDRYIETLDERPWFDWYKWRNFYWGVKWDASEVDTDFATYISFNSPWGRPSDGIFQGIADKFGVNFISRHTYEEDDSEDVYEWYSNSLRKFVALE